MVTIRSAQLAVFRQARVRAFVDRMTGHLATEFPTLFDRQGKERTRAFVERSVASAAELGIKREGAVGALIELWFVYGERFERAPAREWARHMLTHPRLPDYIKIEAIQERFDQASGGRVLVSYPAPEASTA
jgi:hypothetical protein